MNPDYLRRNIHNSVLRNSSVLVRRDCLRLVSEWFQTRRPRGIFRFGEGCGGTSFNGGTLAVDSDANLGTGPLGFNGGTLEALAVVGGGGINSSKAVTLNGGGGTFSADTGTISTLSGVIGGTGAFTKTGAGMLQRSQRMSLLSITSLVSGERGSRSTDPTSSRALPITASAIFMLGET